MKIILADPPNINESLLIANHPNIGILYLSGYLRKKIRDVEIFYLDCRLNEKKHLQLIEKIQPDLYGISISTMRTVPAIKIIREVKKRFPSLPVVCGGAHPTLAPIEILKETQADICVVGEGEETLTEIVEAMRAKKSYDGILGIFFKREGKMIENPKRLFIKDLDSIPFPAWDIVDFNKYIGNYQYMNKPSTLMITSRGCPFNCVFCSNPVWKNNKPWLRLRSPKNICDEITLLYERGIREISIRSDEFNARLDWAIEVCREIQKLGYKDLYFQGNFRADQCSEELVDEMAKSNFWMVQLGIESANQRVLDGIEKKVTLKQIVNVCELMKKYNIKVYGYFMMYNVWEENNVLCHETQEEVDNTVSFIRELGSKGLLDYIAFTTAAPMRGSRLYDLAKRHRVLKSKENATDADNFWIAIPGVSEKQMKKSRLKGMLLQAYFVLKSGRSAWSDWAKLRHKLKYLLKSV